LPYIYSLCFPLLMPWDFMPTVLTIALGYYVPWDLNPRFCF
jgi:hypothetical protein